MARSIEIDTSARRGLGWMTTLGQTEWWYPEGSATRVRLVDMTVRHRLNLAKWLVRNAKNIAGSAVWGWLAMPYPNGEMAADSFDSAMDADIEEAYSNPRKWIKSQPLVRELDRLIKIDFAKARAQGDPVQILKVDF